MAKSFDNSVSDVRAVTDGMLNLYLYPIGAWGVGLLVLFATGHSALALSLCFPLSIYLGILTLIWAGGVLRRLSRGELKVVEANAGIHSIGGIMAVTAAGPAIVFLAEDPLAETTWYTAGSIALVTAVAWLSVKALVRIPGRTTKVMALLIAWVALPVNATGTTFVGFVWGWFDGIL